jgi:hypothetical protein
VTSTVRSLGNPPVTGFGRRVEDDRQIHSLDMLSAEQEGESGHFPDVESGKINVITVLERESEQVCDKSDGDSDRKLVSIGSAY